MPMPDWVLDLISAYQGSTGADTMQGTSGDDEIEAGDGDDSVEGGEGSDVVDAGEGHDVVYGDDGDGFNQGLDASPLKLDIDNIDTISHDGSDGSAGDYAVFSDIATLDDGTSVWGKLVLVEKSDSDLSVQFGYTEGAEIMLEGGDADDTATFRLEFYDPATGDPIYLNSTATFNDLDDNSGFGDSESVIIDGNSFTSFGVDADTSLNTSEDGNTITASGTESNGYTDQDAWFSAAFEDKSSIEFTLEGRASGKAGFTLSGSTIDDAVYTTIEQGADSIFAGEGDDTVYGQGGDDSLMGDEGDDSLDGGEGDDVIDGGTGADTIIGGEGGDTLSGGEGDDYIEGGAGNDFLSTGLGNDTLIGGEGDDTLQNSAGDDSLVGGVGNDSIVATDGDDTLEGGTGNDTMYGGNDNDSLVGGTGDDEMYGESGADTFKIEDNFGNDTIVGGEAGTDSDTVDLGDLTSGVTVTYSGDEAGTITDGSDTINFSEIESMTLTDFADVIDASDDGVGVNIDAGAGDDTITLGAGNDEIATGDGYDELVLTASGGVDTIGDFDLTDDDSNGFFNDQLDVSDLSGGSGTGGAVRVWDVSVTDDGSGNAQLSFPEGEKLVLKGVTPAQLSTPADLHAAGIPCFTPGIRIATQRGAVPVEQIRVGDMLQTADNGFQPVIWTGQRRLSPTELQDRPELRPYCLTPGGMLSPERPMLLSPQHRLLAGRRMLGSEAGLGERFLSAKLLAEVENHCSQIQSTDRAVTYVHLMTEQHQVIFAEGIATETFWPGPEALRGLSPADKAELFYLFPELAMVHVQTGATGRSTAGHVYGHLARQPLTRRDVTGIWAA